MIDDHKYRIQMDENMERLNSRLVDLDSETGKPSNIKSEKAEPTLWGNVATLLEKQDPEDFGLSKEWKKCTEQVNKLNQTVSKDGQTNADFHEALAKFVYRVQKRYQVFG